jgi:casein kinase 1 delta/casein kinase I family protein HRR25
MLVYFARGSLPWEGLKARTTEELNEKIGQMKERMSGEEICRGLPVEFAKYMFKRRDNYYKYCPLQSTSQNLFHYSKYLYYVVQDVLYWGRMYYALLSD